MAYDDFETMRVSSTGGVVRAVIDHPPINLLDLPLMLELDRLGQAVEDDDDAKVLVLSSADDEFFIAHADVEPHPRTAARGPERAERRSSGSSTRWSTGSARCRRRRSP